MIAAVRTRSDRPLPLPSTGWIDSSMAGSSCRRFAAFRSRSVGRIPRAVPELAFVENRIQRTGTVPQVSEGGVDAAFDGATQLCPIPPVDDDELPNNVALGSRRSSVNVVVVAVFVRSLPVSISCLRCAAAPLPGVVRERVLEMRQRSSSQATTRLGYADRGACLLSASCSIDDGPCAVPSDSVGVLLALLLQQPRGRTTALATFRELQKCDAAILASTATGFVDGNNGNNSQRKTRGC